MPYVSLSFHFLGTDKTTSNQDVSHVTVQLISPPTCGRPDGRSDGGSHGGDTVIVLGVAGLDGSQIAVAPGSEAARQVQSLHGLGLYLAEHRLTDGLKLAVDFCFTHLWGGRGGQNKKRTCSQ